MAHVIPNPDTTLLIAPDPDRQKLASLYAHSRSTVTFMVTLVTVLLTIIMLAPPFTVALRNWARSISSDPGIEVGLYALVLAAVILLASLPFSYALGYALPRKYNLMQMTALAWWTAHARSTGLALVIWLVITEIFYWIVRAGTASWWLLVIVLGSGSIVLLNYFWPLDRFGMRKLTPSNDPELARRLSLLTARAGLPPLSLWVLPVGNKLKVVNAWIMGMGRARKIVLSDALVESFNYDELEAVLAHELAHAARTDITKRLAFTVVSVLAASSSTYFLLPFITDYLGLGGAADVAMLPYVLMVYIWIYTLTTMISGSRSRKGEGEADRYAMQLTGNSDAFKSAMIKLADMNLIETHPSGRTRKLQGNYPAISERMTMADAAAGRSVPPASQTGGWKRPARRVVRDGSARTPYTTLVVQRIRIK